MSSTKEDTLEIITNSDSNLKVTKASVEPTQKYFSENKSELDIMIITVSTGACCLSKMDITGWFFQNIN